jgi:hypothetical protein
MGVMAAAPGLPALIMVPRAAHWIHRRPRRPLMMVLDIVRALVLLTIPATWMLGRLTFLQVLVVTALVAGATTVFLVADQAYWPTLVGRERVETGNALIASPREWERPPVPC